MYGVSTPQSFLGLPFWVGWVNGTLAPLLGAGILSFLGLPFWVGWVNGTIIPILGILPPGQPPGIPSSRTSGAPAEIRLERLPPPCTRYTSGHVYLEPALSAWNDSNGACTGCLLQHCCLRGGQQSMTTTDPGHKGLSSALKCQIICTRREPWIAY